MQIAFSGRLGSGKSTVCAILRDKYGYEIYSTGTVQRKVAEEMGISTLELNKLMKENPELDHKIDDAVTELSRKRKGDKLVYDSRMAWHFAENTFKVYMYVDPTIAAKRVLAADRGNVEKYKDIDDARSQLIERSLEENRRYKDIYGVDNLDFFNYDLIIDSTTATPEEIADKIATYAEEYESKPFGETRFLLSPNVVYPTLPLRAATEEKCTTPSVCIKNRLFYVVCGHNALRQALSEKLPFFSVELCKNDELPQSSLETLKEYEDTFDFQYSTLPY